MSQIVSGFSFLSKLVHQKMLDSNSEFYISKMHLFNVPADAPVLTDLSGETPLAVATATSFQVGTSTSKIGVTGTASLQNQITYSRAYLTNSANEIIQVINIQPETKSEISIDVIFNLGDDAKIAGL